MQAESDYILIVAVLGTLIFAGFSFFVISFLFFFTKKQAQHRAEKVALKTRYDQEILNSQIEVQNLTLQTVGQELHDNIGQLLTVAKINLNVLEDAPLDDSYQRYLNQTAEIVSQSIYELRALTKSLDRDFIQHFGLVESITHELQRLQKTNRFKTSLTLYGEEYSLGYDREIILFRVVQELLTNAIKHSQATTIQVNLNFAPAQFILCFDDDGRGFDYELLRSQTLQASGAGLRNVHRRVELIGGHCTYQSTIGKGTTIRIEVPSSAVFGELL